MRPRAALFGLPRLATSFIATALVTLTLPAMVVGAVGDARKGLHLGLVSGAAAVVSLGVLYASGRHSDRAQASRGRKRYVLYGLGATLPPLVVLLVSPRYAVLVVAMLVLVAARSASEAAHLPILADFGGLPDADRHRSALAASIAFYHVAGAGLGAIAFGWGRPAPLAMVLVAIALVGFHGSHREHEGLPEDTHLRDGSRASALTRDVVLIVAARTLFLAGTFIISTFLFFLVRDVLGAVDARRTTAWLFAVAIAGGVAAALPAGRLAARIGDRRVLFVAGTALAAAIAGFVGWGRAHGGVAWACMLIYGAAFAAVMSSGISLTARVVPSRDVAGRVMAVATGSTFVSQGLASLAGAALLDPLNSMRPNLGYVALAILAEAFLLAGGLVLRRVRPG